MRKRSKEPEPIKIVIINKSDSTGGAAVVSRRLMEAFREEGIDARMLVTEKLTDSPFVEVAASQNDIKKNFLLERLKIFIRNGFSRKTLFKIDTATDGLPLWRHPLVKKADAVLLNWVNQGMLSLEGVKKIQRLRKPVLWTMHDMWCMTGVCHHAGECKGFLNECGDCPLLGWRKGKDDISHKTWLRKSLLKKNKNKITYVAVSNWLAEKASQSSLLKKGNVVVIPNVFTLNSDLSRINRSTDKISLLFGAARLDDPIKGLPVLVETTRILRSEYPEWADRMELVTFGGVKDPDSLNGFAIPHQHLGMVRGEDKIREVYENSDILVSASSYETLPGTLVEAQAYGCLPVSFNQGGQSDIVDHMHTGYLAEYSTVPHTAASNLTKGIIWAASVVADEANHNETIIDMKYNVRAKFSPKAVTQAYLNLIKSHKY